MEQSQKSRSSMKKIGFFSLFLILLSCARQQPGNSSAAFKVEPETDVHTHSNYNHCRVVHLQLTADIDFSKKQLNATATWQLAPNRTTDTLILDARNLVIESVSDQSGEKLAFSLSKNEAVFGQALSIFLSPKSVSVSINYQTTDSSEALQWLEPSQTSGKNHPFLFTQSQAILARTLIPCQDGPGVRFTYDAEIHAPKGMMALMSATNPTKVSEDGVYHFRMEKPVPSYLMALACGVIGYQEIGPHTAVYAEPEVLEKDAAELSETEAMLSAAEKLYGKYAWGRYDVLMLPPSFPFGGMENPRLTFATPTIIAGDKSLVSLIAHEMAHSWSGNLVTNATWNDFWLNEGFTVYFELRIMEAVYGRDYSEMLAALEKNELMGEIESIGPKSPDTHLKLDLKGRNPDDGLTDIAYVKGYLFLRLLEETVGRADWDAFLKGYFQRHAFGTMTTEAFLDELKAELLAIHSGTEEKVNITAWVYGPGLPANCPEVHSTRFDQVDAQRMQWTASNGDCSMLHTEKWSTHEWLRFITLLPTTTGADRLTKFDQAFKLTQSTNAEIQGAWFLLTTQAGYHAADEARNAFLISVGRRKFLTPIYEEMKKNNLAEAKSVYAKARPNYHAVARNTMDELLK